MGRGADTQAPEQDIIEVTNANPLLDLPGPWWKYTLDGVETRLRLVGPDMLVMHRRMSSWKEPCIALRCCGATAMQALPANGSESAHSRNHSVDYLNSFQQQTPQSWHDGHDDLSPCRAGQSRSDSHLEPKCDSTEDRQYYLACYVGELDGSVCPKLRQLSPFFDSHFDGLCVHRVPSLAHLGSFHVGVVIGPSGSGKRSLVRRTFGTCPQVDWVDDTPVIGHFASTSRAHQFCNVVCLGYYGAMQQFMSLSRGEQAKATLARLLDAAVNAAHTPIEPEMTLAALSELPRLRPLVLEEFTSLVDRTTALRIAQGIQQLVREYNLQVVMSSCHSDFIGQSLLEPDWLYECGHARLLRFDTEMWKKVQH